MYTNCFLELAGGGMIGFLLPDCKYSSPFPNHTSFLSPFLCHEKEDRPAPPAGQGLFLVKKSESLLRAFFPEPLLGHGKWIRRRPAATKRPATAATANFMLDATSNAESVSQPQLHDLSITS